MRIRDIGIRIGRGTPGPFNCITDVDGVRVGHRTVIEKRQRCHSNRRDSHRAASRDGSTRACYAGCHVLNGNGDATGLEWIRESGLLTTPIAFTNTHSVGVVRDALVQAERISADKQQYWCMPVVLETFDGVLNDIWGQHVTPSHVYDALAAARGGHVDEGCVGGGTGMICHEFKGASERHRASCPIAMAAGRWEHWFKPTMVAEKNCASVDIPSARCSATSRLHSGNATSASQAWGRSWLRSRRTRLCCHINARRLRTVPASDSPG